MYTVYTGQSKSEVTNKSDALDIACGYTLKTGNSASICRTVTEKGRKRTLIESTHFTENGKVAITHRLK